MDENQYNKTVLRLKQVGEVIDRLPDAIQSQAFSFFTSYITGKPEAATHKPSNDTAPKLDGSDLDKESFFGANDHSKPAENVQLIAAYLYKEHGTAAFSVAEINEIATDVGITVPERVDMTLKASKSNGKNLFTSAGRGAYKPTVHGEAFLKETYSIKKGTKAKAA